MYAKVIKYTKIFKLIMKPKFIAIRKILKLYKYLLFFYFKKK